MHISTHKKGYSNGSGGYLLYYVNERYSSPINSDKCQNVEELLCLSCWHERNGHAKDARDVKYSEMAKNYAEHVDMLPGSDLAVLLPTRIDKRYE